MPSDTLSQVSDESLARKHEVTDRSVRNVLAIGGAAAALVLVGMLFAGGAIYWFARHRPMQQMQPLGIILAPNLAPLERFPKPNLDIDDDHAARMQSYAAQEARLNSYGWVNRSNGTVHIPIERAMALIAKRAATATAPSLTPESPLQLRQNISEP
jgi:hypothetical protein